jgi:CheY-like chemotaxis protein
VTIPIIICDDSSLARKQLARSLPSGWDVSVTLCAGGREAIAAIEQGLGDILFLDLTMPEMDGFEVLSHVREHDLPSLAVVVSADIQESTRERVLRLGALAFVRKPVDARELTEVLSRFGILDVLSDRNVDVEQSVDLKDWCQEISNVAMGRAGDLLAKAIGVKVELSIPRVRQLGLAELNMMLSASREESGPAIVTQGFIGRHITGEILLFFRQTAHPELAQVLRLDADDQGVGEYELILEVSNLLVGAYMNALSELLEVDFSQSHPRVWGRGTACAQRELEKAEQTLLAVELDYAIGAEKFACSQLVLFSEPSLAALRRCAAEGED